MTELMTELQTLEDGCVRVCVELDGDRRCLVVSSMHLTQDAERRLERCIRGEIPHG